MLKTRIIPTMLWKDVGLVKGIGFDSWRRTGSLMPAIKVYNARQVDELILVDIMATGESRAPDFDMISEISAECFVPFTVGGGIRELAHVRELLRAGADKVCINSAAYENPALIRESAERFGSQCIVASLDARRTADGRFECYARSGALATGKEASSWAQYLEELGAGEILVTSIERDGTMTGYDLDLIRSVTRAVRIPVIASGGAGDFRHFLSAITEAGASAVAAASMFHFTQNTPLEAKLFLGAHGVPVRISGHAEG